MPETELLRPRCEPIVFGTSIVLSGTTPLTRAELPMLGTAAIESLIKTRLQAARGKPFQVRIKTAHIRPRNLNLVTVLATHFHAVLRFLFTDETTRDEVGLMNRKVFYVFAGRRLARR